MRKQIKKEEIKNEKETEVSLEVRRKQLQQALEDVTQQLEARAKEERQEKLKAVVDLMQQHNITVHDIAKFLGTPLTTRQRKQTKPLKEKAPARYFNPANPSEVWSGRGRAPEWTRQFLTSGDASKRIYKKEIHIKRP